MNKEEVVNLMLSSVNEDNKTLCLKSGMTEEEAESQIQQSQPSLSFILGNVYDKLKSAELIS